MGNISHQESCWNKTIIIIVRMAGPKWAIFYVGPIQFGVCYGSVVAGILIGGQNLKVRFFRYILPILDL